VLSNKEPHQYYGMQTTEGFSGSSKLTLTEFWLAIGPAVAAILPLAVLIITWDRPFAVGLRDRLTKTSPWSPMQRIIGIEMRSPQVQALARPNPQERALPV